MCWRESLSYSAFGLALLSPLKRGCIQLDKFAMYKVGKRVEASFGAEEVQSVVNYAQSYQVELNALRHA
jgi:hypothetical protein